MCHFRCVGPISISALPLSIGYVSPAWPAAAFCNGIVTYVSTIAPTLRAMGHRVTVIAGHVAEGTHEDTVYNLEQAQKPRNTSQRAVAALGYHIAPRVIHARMMKRAITSTVGRAQAERQIQILEMEETFGLRDGSAKRHRSLFVSVFTVLGSSMGWRRVVSRMRCFAVVSSRKGRRSAPHMPSRHLLATSLSASVRFTDSLCRERR